MIKCTLGLQLGVWIMQVSLFSSVHINRFHCSHRRVVLATGAYSNQEKQEIYHVHAAVV